MPPVRNCPFMLVGDGFWWYVVDCRQGDEWWQATSFSAALARLLFLWHRYPRLTRGGDP